MRLWDYLKSAKCLTEIYDEFCDEKPSTIRGRLNENIGVCFKRIGRGVYIATDGEVQAVVIHGDSWEGLKQLETASIDFCVMDSPYTALDHQMQYGTTRKRNLNKGWDFPTRDLDEEFYTELLRVMKPGAHVFSFMPAIKRDTYDYVYGHIKMATECGWTFNSQWIWDKGSMTLGYNGRPRHELIQFFSKGKRKLFAKGHPMRATPDVLQYKREHTRWKKHQAQKPVDLIARLIEFGTEAFDVVLDPFGGSLSTAAACLQTKRHSISFECDKGMIESCLS